MAGGQGYSQYLSNGYLSVVGRSDVLGGPRLSILRDIL